jgi:FAD/FMN-containing dehydrogenase
VLAEVAAERELTAVRTDGKSVSLTGAELRDFSASLQGGVLLSGQTGYDEARRLWNGAFDRHPALIVRCTNIQDVTRAVDFARSHSLLTAVRGGGHSVSGQSSCDGGLMIDLSLMRAVHVDAQRKTARVEPGVLLGEFDHAAQALGLASTAGTVTHTGVAGLTLGGGMGRLARKLGLACDNLRSAEMVTADGKQLRVSEHENTQLFWAIRGGGGNFGIVTAFEFQLHPIGPVVLGGVTLFPYANAREILGALVEFAERSPDEMYLTPFVTRAKDGLAVGFEACYCGTPEAGERLLAPLRRLGKPVVDTVSAKPYVEVQAATDALFPPGRGYYFKSGFVSSISPKLIDEIVERFQGAPPWLHNIPLLHAGGAMGRVKPDATAFWNRQARHDIAVWAAWDDRTESKRDVESVRSFWRVFEPYTQGYYINTDVPDDERRLRETYGGNYARLVQLKNRYDPTNLFRLNANIRPTV